MATSIYLKCQFDNVNSTQFQQLDELISLSKIKDLLRKAKEKELEQKDAKIAKIKAELELLIQKKNIEFEKSRAKMRRISAKDFRLGWNQALTKEEERYYASLDFFDTHYGFSPMGYSPVRGMVPGDLPSPDHSAFEEDEDEISSSSSTKTA